MLFVSLTPPGVTPESFHLVLRVLDSASGNLRPPWLLAFLNGQFCVTPGGASILINEWVSLWDNCTVWGLGLHHAHKCLSHLRKLKRAGRIFVPFLWILLTFILTNSVMAIKLRKSVRSALNHSAKSIQSPAMEQPQNLSVGPQVFLNFFPNWAPSHPVPFYWVATALASFSQPPPPSNSWHPGSYDWVGISRYLSTKLCWVSRS